LHFFKGITLIKATTILFLLVLNLDFAFGQRTFQLDSLTESFFYLRNLDEGHVTVVRSKGLTLLVDSLPNIIQVGLHETVRCAYLRLGCFAITPENKDPYECKCQVEAQDANVGYWIYHRSELLLKVSKPFSIINTLPLDFEEEGSLNHNLAIKQRKHVKLKYIKTVDEIIYFENIYNKEPYQISKSGGIIDYSKISEFTYDKTDDLRMFLIRMGVFGLKSPARHGNQKESRAMYKAQRLKVGVWKNYNSKLNPHGNFKDTIPPEKRISFQKNPSIIPWYKKLFADFSNWRKSLSEVDRSFYNIIFCSLLVLIAIILILLSKFLINNIYKGRTKEERTFIINLAVTLIFSVLSCAISAILG